MSLDMLAFRPGNAIARYRVEPDGTIEFAGGRDALNDQVTWSGVMTDEQINALCARLDEHDWFDRSIRSLGPDNDDVRYDITARRPGDRVRLRIHGLHPDIEPVYALLDEVARQRHEPILNTLPRPDPP